MNYRPGVRYELTRNAAPRPPAPRDRSATAALLLLLPLIFGCAAALLRVRTLNEEIELHREAVAGLERRYQEEALRPEPPVLEVLNALETHMAVGMTLEGARFSGQGAGIEVEAADEAQVFALEDGLRRSGLFRSVTVQDSRRAGNRVRFRLSLSIRAFTELVP